MLVRFDLVITRRLQHDVRRLQVTVQHAALVSVLDGSGQSEQEICGVAYEHSAGVRHEPSGQGHAGTVFGGDVADGTDDASLIDRDHVGVIEDGSSPGLEKKSLAQRRRDDRLAAGDLERDVPA